MERRSADLMTERTIRFTRGIPAVESFTPDQLAECAKSVLTEYYKTILQYAPSRGFEPLRQLLAEREGVDQQRVVLGQGSLQLQDICARVLLHPDQTVFVEAPSYDRAINVLKRAGGQLTGFPVELDGVNVDQVEAALKNGTRPTLFYLIPDFQNPSGAVLSFEKRQRLIDLSREYNFWIVEDSPYRLLRYRGAPVPSMFELAPDRVLKMSSYSKLISPGLRVGYMIAPEAIAEKVAQWAEDTYINASYLNQAIVYDYERRGWLEPHIEDLKSLYCPRLDAMLESLDRHMSGLATWHKPDGGFFIGMTLKGKVRANELLQRAAAVSLLLTDGRSFFPNNGGDTFVRLPFCALTPDEIEEGVARLVSIVKTF
jgi:2-aminoadipate transaminase